MSGEVSLLRTGGVVQLILDAPTRRNALSRPMLAALGDALNDLDADATGVVISGSGGVFSAGADFRELTGTSADLAYDEAVSAVREAIISCPRIVVAAIEGPCIGAAADLALACDVRIGGADSFLEIPATRLGLLYNPDVLAWAANAFSGDVVRRIFLLGERLHVTEAVALGLVTSAMPAGEAVKGASELLHGITHVQLDAIAATKGFLAAIANGNHDESAWQARRRQLLDSPARRGAITRARAQHVKSFPLSEG